MSLLPASVAGLALGILILPVAPNAPVTTKYRIDTKNETTVDLSGFGQPSQQVNFGLVSWIAVTLTVMPTPSLPTAVWLTDLRT